MESRAGTSDGIRERLRNSWRILLKELSAFGVVGAINFALDIALFQIMYDIVGADALVSTP